MANVQTQQAKQDYSFFSVMGPTAVLGAGFDTGMSHCVEAADEIYTDRYKAKPQGTPGKFELGVKNSLGGAFGRSAAGTTVSAPENDNAAAFWKRAEMNFNRRHRGPRPAGM